MLRVKRYNHVPYIFELVNSYKELVNDVRKNNGFTFARKFLLFLKTVVPFFFVASMTWWRISGSSGPPGPLVSVARGSPGGDWVGVVPRGGGGLLWPS